MTGIAVQTPFPVILNLSGVGLNQGNVYVGAPNQDPVTNPQAVYWDAALTVPASQPLSVLGGYIMRLGSPANAYTSGTYSLKVTDKLGVQVFYQAALTDAFVATGSGATTASSVATRFGDQPNAIRDFGATPDGTTDNTAALQAFFNACQTYRKTGHLPGSAVGSFYKTTAPIVLSGEGGNVRGDGAGHGSWIWCNGGNFDAVFQLGATAGNKVMSDILVETTGTTTRCLNAQSGSQGCTFQRVSFQGDLAGALAYSQSAGYLTFDQCGFTSNGASTIGLVLDMYNQGARVIGRSLFSGVGKGMQITKSGAGGRVEGAAILDAQFLNTGPVALDIGNSLLTQVLGCNLDQAGNSAITISAGADDAQIIGNWLGLVLGSHGACVSIDSSAGSGHIIQGNQLNNGDSGVNIIATGAARVSGVDIADNVFAGQLSSALALDSVNACRITGNRDRGTPANGSWVTSGTFGAGSYLFDNNNWYTTAPTTFHAASSYRFGNDTGIVGRNRGANTPGGAATSLTVSHGLFRTPTAVLVTPNGAAGVFNTLNFTSTTFDIAWATAGTQTWNWSAEV